MNDPAKNETIDLEIIEDLENIGIMTPLRKEEWELFLYPIIGALALSQAGTHAFMSVKGDQRIIANFRDSYLTGIDAGQPPSTTKGTLDIRIRAALVVNAVASLGATCLSSMSEMYKKIGFRHDFDLIFGRDYHWDSVPWEDDGKIEFQERLSTISKRSAAMSDLVAFKQKYFTAVVHKWTANQSSAYLIHMIRNSLGYGQWTVRHEPRPRIRLWSIDRGDKNENKNELRTFDVTMDLIDIRILIYDTLQTVLDYANEYCGNVPPSYRMLERVVAKTRNQLHDLTRFYDNDFWMDSAAWRLKVSRKDGYKQPTA